MDIGRNLIFVDASFCAQPILTENTPMNMISLPPCSIGGIATQIAPVTVEQKQLFAIADTLFGSSICERSRRFMEQVFLHPSIQRRHFALDSPTELSKLPRETQDEKIARFTRYATKLSCSAILKATSQAGISVNQIDALLINTCTGYICPGLSSYVAEQLGLRGDIFFYDLVGSGCGGAIPNLQLGAHLAAQGKKVVCVSVEICSATFEMSEDFSLILSNALFSDGAAAVVLQPGGEPGDIALKQTASCLVPENREDIRYYHREGRLHNKLSAALPKITAEKVGGLLSKLTAERRDNPNFRWIIHPGGAKILRMLAEKLGLGESDFSYSFEVLREHGNMSSPSVLFAMERFMRNSGDPATTGVLCAFGAGLSGYAMVFEKLKQP